MLLPFVEKFLRISCGILEKLVLFFFIVVLVFGGYCLYDIYSIYESAANDDLLKYRPGGNSSESGYSFEDLCNINGDVIAWITIENTKIDYPVCQSGDNSKYVNTSASGEFSLSGCPFLDFRNKPDFSDDYNMIYGHHMDQDVMFGGLDKFAGKLYFKSHKKGTLYLKDGTAYPLTFFSCVKTDAYDIQIYTHRPLENEDENAGNTQDEFLQYIKKHSVQYEEPDGMDIIALSTCSDTRTNARLLLFGTIERGEKFQWETKD